MKKVILLLYQLFIFAPLFVVATFITAVTVMIACLIGNRRFWSYYPPHCWAMLTCRLALCRIKVIHKSKLDPKQSYVFVPNHQSAFDIFLIYGYLGQNIKWVQKQELRKLPFVGKASEVAGHIFVDQANLKSMKDTIAKAKAQLGEGVSISIFPEGCRTETGKMGRFKRGAFIIAKEMNLPVVPITVNGAFDVMQIHTYLINPGRMELIIHDPIATENSSDQDISKLVSECHRVVHGGLWDKYK